MLENKLGLCIHKIHVYDSSCASFEIICMHPKNITTPHYNPVCYEAEGKSMLISGPWIECYFYYRIVSYIYNKLYFLKINMHFLDYKNYTDI